MRIAICDDDKTDLSLVAGSIRESFDEGGLPAELSLFGSSMALLESAKALPYQLYVLDIHMPDLDGVELAKLLRQADETAAIVFLSAHDERVFDTFAVLPFGFIRKSNYLADMTDTVTRYLAWYRAHNVSRDISVTAEAV